MAQTNIIVKAGDVGKVLVSGEASSTEWHTVAGKSFNIGPVVVRDESEEGVLAWNEVAHWKETNGKHYILPVENIGALELDATPVTE